MGTYTTNIWPLPGGTGIGIRKADGTEVEFTAAQIATILDGAGTDDIADGAVTAAKLAANAVETAKVKDGAITAAKTATAVQASLGKADSAVQSTATGKVIASGEYTMVEDDDTGGVATIAAGITVESAIVQIVDANNIVLHSDEVVAFATTNITISDGAATYACTAGHKVRWIAFGTAAA